MQNNQEILESLDDLIEKRLAQMQNKPDQIKNSYVAQISAKGKDEMLKKIAEETSEMILASKNNDKNNLINETADLWFHCLLILHHHGINSSDVVKELAHRLGKSGIEEKQSRNK